MGRLGARQVTVSPLAIVMVDGTNASSPPSPPSFTAAASAAKARDREAAPASAKDAAACVRKHYWMVTRILLRRAQPRSGHPITRMTAPRMQHIAAWARPRPAPGRRPGPEYDPPRLVAARRERAVLVSLRTLPAEAMEAVACTRAARRCTRAWTRTGADTVEASIFRGWKI